MIYEFGTQDVDPLKLQETRSRWLLQYKHVYSDVFEEMKLHLNGLFQIVKLWISSTFLGVEIQ